jgi:hypothetical protein
VARVALDAVQPSRVHGHHRTLHINEIVLAQSLILSPAKQSVCHSATCGANIARNTCKRHQSARTHCSTRSANEA